ncbi:hypothetical protein AB1Y20_013216 [Prymnesium parvum]|uniref:W2 domain-containing protein n=1 Tax=Prymnesium parvum TaxID=97485 RepID=A0AB34INL4_PRYPA
MTDVEEAAEDARISQLYSMADKLAPADFVALVERLGADDAIVYGGMCTDKQMARAHFIVTALLDTDDQSLAESIEQRKELLKASVAAGGERGESCMLAAIESFTLNQEDPEKCSESTQTYDKVLQLLWEWDIVSEDGIRAWQGDERAARLLRVTTEGARALRERGEVFFDWLEHGEEK